MKDKFPLMYNTAPAAWFNSYAMKVPPSTTQYDVEVTPHGGARIVTYGGEEMVVGPLGATVTLKATPKDDDYGVLRWRATFGPQYAWGGTVTVVIGAYSIPELTTRRLPKTVTASGTTGGGGRVNVSVTHGWSAVHPGSVSVPDADYVWPGEEIPQGGHPLTFQAIADDGYEFSHWEGISEDLLQPGASSTDHALYYYGPITENTALRAVFQPKEEYCLDLSAQLTGNCGEEDCAGYFTASPAKKYYHRRINGDSHRLFDNPRVWCL
jgi:hypothetical protein